MGKIGRTIDEVTGQKVARITGDRLVEMLSKEGVVAKFLHSLNMSDVSNNTLWSGLDPAGPRFVDGPLVDAIPESHANLLRF